MELDLLALPSCSLSIPLSLRLLEFLMMNARSLNVAMRRRKRACLRLLPLGSRKTERVAVF